jgi:hypothetical protein
MILIRYAIVRKRMQRWYECYEYCDIDTTCAFPWEALGRQKTALAKGTGYLIPPCKNSLYPTIFYVRRYVLDIPDPE